MPIGSQSVFAIQEQKKRVDRTQHEVCANDADECLVFVAGGSLHKHLAIHPFRSAVLYMPLCLCDGVHHLESVDDKAPSQTSSEFDDGSRLGHLLAH